MAKCNSMCVCVWGEGGSFVEEQPGRGTSNMGNEIGRSPYIVTINPVVPLLVVPLFPLTTLWPFNNASLSFHSGVLISSSWVLAVVALCRF